MRTIRFYQKAVMITVMAMLLSSLSILNPILHADASNPPNATLVSSTEKVAPGESFTVKYGVTNVTTALYAQDVTIQYDPAVMEYIPDSVQSLQEGVIIANELSETTPGVLRVLLASLGSEHPITEDSNILELSFKAADVSQPTDGVIGITQAVLSGDDGEEISVNSVSVTVQIAAESGVSGDINGDGKVSVGDLAMIAAKYGMDSSSPDWDQVKHMDLDGSGAIDVADLAMVAKKIVDQE